MNAGGAHLAGTFHHRLRLLHLKDVWIANLRPRSIRDRTLLSLLFVGVNSQQAPPRALIVAQSSDVKVVPKRSPERVTTRVT